MPSLADKHGRRPVLFLTYILQVFAMAGIIVTSDLNATIFYVFVLGFTHPGKNIIGLNYVLEQCPMSIKSQIVGLFLVVETAWLMAISASYEYVDRSYKTLMYGGLFVSVWTLIFVILQYPESPKYFFTMKKWNESRKAMEVIAKYNGVEEKLPEFMFKEEYE
jgi:MFS family permease